jgi:hypothetical protein
VGTSANLGVTGSLLRLELLLVGLRHRHGRFFHALSFWTGLTLADILKCTSARIKQQDAQRAATWVGTTSSVSLMVADDSDVMLTWMSACRDEDFFCGRREGAGREYAERISATLRCGSSMIKLNSCRRRLAAAAAAAAATAAAAALPA